MCSARHTKHFRYITHSLEGKIEPFLSSFDGLLYKHTEFDIVVDGGRYCPSSYCIGMVVTLLHSLTILTDYSLSWGFGIPATHERLRNCTRFSESPRQINQYCPASESRLSCKFLLFECGRVPAGEICLRIINVVLAWKICLGLCHASSIGSSWRNLKKNVDIDVGKYELDVSWTQTFPNSWKARHMTWYFSHYMRYTLTESAQALRYKLRSAFEHNTKVDIEDGIVSLSLQSGSGSLDNVGPSQASPRRIP